MQAAKALRVSWGAAGKKPNVSVIDIDESDRYEVDGHQRFMITRKGQLHKAIPEFRGLESIHAD